MGIKILHLEDNAADTELIRLELRHLDIAEVFVAANKKEYLTALKDGDFDIILSDYNIPDILGLESLEFAKSHGHNVPFIYVSGAIGEEGAVEMLKNGATDYVLKSKLQKLPISIDRALRAFEDHKTIEEKEWKIREQEQEYRQLVDRMQEGFIRISDKGMISIANPAALKLLEYSKEELLNSDAKDILKIPFYDKEFYAMVETNSFELILTRKSGDRFWAHLGLTPQFGKRGKLLGTSAIIRDISNQKLEEVWREIIAKVSSDRTTEENSLEVVFEKLHKELWSQMPSRNFFAAIRTRSNKTQLKCLSNAETKPRALAFSKYVLENSKPLWHYGQAVKMFEKEHNTMVAGDVPESIICVPILSGENVKGVIGLLDYDDSHAFNEFDFQVLKLVGTHLGALVESIEDEQDRKRILQISEDLICIVEKDGSFRYTNPAFKNNLGYSSSDLEHVKVEELLYETDAKTHKLMEKMLNSNKRKLQFESTIKTKNGEVRYISWTAMAHEKEQSFYCIGRDFTEKRSIQLRIEESERRYRGLFQRMNEGLLRSDEKGVILTVNPGLCQMLGYVESEMLGKNGYELLLDKATATRLKQKIKYRKDGKPGLYETNFIHKNGDPVWTQVSSTPDYDANGEFIGVMSIILDVSERKKAEMEAMAMKERFTRQLEQKVTERTLELENAQKELAISLKKEKELGRLKSHFVSTASHQFRTPLSVIQSSIGILSMQIEDSNIVTDIDSFRPKFNKIYNRMKEQIQRMTDLMDDVLILGKINDGNIPVRMQTQSIVEVCENLLESFANISKGEQIKLQVLGKSKKLRFDKKLFEHAMSNLVSNALKYSPDTKAPSVEITFKKDFTEIKVQDQGIGIPKSELKHIFEPFYRASNANEFGGTGLGTAIAKEYIELIGGTIEAKSTVGKGSLFIIHLKN